MELTRETRALNARVPTPSGRASNVLASWGLLLLCWLSPACDSMYSGVHRFGSAQSMGPNEEMLTRLNEIAAAHGFKPAEIRQEDAAKARERGRQVLAVFAGNIREDPPWGSCSLTLLASSSGTVELEGFAFPEGREPQRLEELRGAFSAYLLQHGYSPVEK